MVQQVLPFLWQNLPWFLNPSVKPSAKPALKTRSQIITEDSSPPFLLSEATGALPVQRLLSTTRKSASGRRVAQGLVVQVPKRWNKTQREEATNSLLQRLYAQEKKRNTLLQQARQQPLLSITNKTELSTYATELNQSTLNSPVKGFSVGSAKHSRLAQVNLKTGRLTVSKYCLGQVPELAFRYLLLHELTHFYHGGHGADFWRKVRQFCPDARTQHHLMAAWHQQQTLEQEPGYIAYSP